ncbi:transport protein particle component [Sphaerosporella brunnea]|uniref:Transport protein particle component n=1 Tax=Sphaerosporella brunnea TaxID=1250544 RepID=A0A5J5F453_9PEZI|nr:transport protein particle component [Sphaerosporella brunnea]
MSFDPPLPPFGSSDPHATFLNSTALDLLLIEIVPLARRLANEAASRSSSSTSVALDDDEEREAMFYRLEQLGYKVGQGLVERFSRDRARMVETLDVIKFICKDLWTIVFRKQIDNLKTNHRGVYVLTDNSFRPFSRMSVEVGSNAVVRAQPFLWFPCGILRGALANMGVNASVQAETTELPSAIFKIETISSKST